MPGGTVWPVVLTIAVVLFGLLIGRLRGGRLRNLSDWHVNSWRVLLAAVAAWVALELFGADDVWLAAAAILGAMWFGFRNLHLTGMPIVLIGLGLNLVPIALNGHIPTSVDALLIADVTTREDLPRLDLTAGRQLETSDDLLPELGDIIAVPVTQQVLSFGDLIAMAGLATVAVQRNAVTTPQGFRQEGRGRGAERPRSRARATQGASRGRRVRHRQAHPRSHQDALAVAPRPSRPEPPLPRAVPTGGDLPKRERVSDVLTGSKSRATPAHDCGMAPRPVPVSAFQYSARPEAITPRRVASARVRASATRSWRRAATQRRYPSCGQHGPRQYRSAS